MEAMVEWMASESGGIAEYDELHASPSYGDIHTSQVVEKTDVSLLICTHHADKYHITLLTLKAIYSVDTYHLTQGLQCRSFLESMT